MKCPHCQNEVQLILMPGSNGSLRQQHKANPVPVSNQLGAVLEGISVDDLDEKAAEFINGLRERHEKYRDRMHPLSVKQQSYLESIVAGKCNKDSWD